MDDFCRPEKRLLQHVLQIDGDGELGIEYCSAFSGQLDGTNILTYGYQDAVDGRGRCRRSLGVREAKDKIDAEEGVHFAFSRDAKWGGGGICVLIFFGPD